MNRQKSKLLSGVTLSILFAVNSASSQLLGQGELELAPGRELLVSFTSTEAGIAHSVSQPNRRILTEMPLAETNGEVTLSSTRVARALAACEQFVKANPGAMCEPNVLFKSSATPNDPYWAWMKNLRSIDAPRAWNSVTGSRGVLVAIIDTGVDYFHPDLAANIAVNESEIANNGIDDDGNGYVDDSLGYDFAGRDGDPLDENGHGTHVAGTVGASGNDGEGVVGVSWRASLLPVRVLDRHGSGSLAQVIAGIDYAVARGARVINLSLGAPYGSKLLLLSLQRAQAAGTVIVAAAGNDGLDNDSSPSFPANYELEALISVAATDRDDLLADFSNFGAKSVHLAAPGVSILSTYLFGSYVFLSGTSMATPHVSGAAALVLGLNPTLTGVQVKDLLLNSSDKLSALEGLVVSGGRLNVGSAISSVLAGRTPEPREGHDVEGLGIDVAVRYAKNGERALVVAEVYSLVTGLEVVGAEAKLVCGRRKIVGRGISGADGRLKFRVIRSDQAVYCSVRVQNEGVSTSSGIVGVRASASR